MTRTNPYEFGLDKNEANFVALSPLSFIERSAGVYPDRTAVDLRIASPDLARHLCALPPPGQWRWRSAASAPATPSR